MQVSNKAIPVLEEIITKAKSLSPSSYVSVDRRHMTQIRRLVSAGVISHSTGSDNPFGTRTPIRCRPRKGAEEALERAKLRVKRKDALQRRVKAVRAQQKQARKDHYLSQALF